MAGQIGESPHARLLGLIWGLESLEQSWCISQTSDIECYLDRVVCELRCLLNSYPLLFNWISSSAQQWEQLLLKKDSPCAFLLTRLWVKKLKCGLLAAFLKFSYNEFFVAEDILPVLWEVDSIAELREQDLLTQNTFLQFSVVERPTRRASSCPARRGVAAKAPRGSAMTSATSLNEKEGSPSIPTSEGPAATVQAGSAAVQELIATAPEVGGHTPAPEIRQSMPAADSNATSSTQPQQSRRSERWADIHCECVGESSGPADVHEPDKEGSDKDDGGVPAKYSCANACTDRSLVSFHRSPFSGERGQGFVPSSQGSVPTEGTESTELPPENASEAYQLAAGHQDTMLLPAGSIGWTPSADENGRSSTVPGELGQPLQQRLEAPLEQHQPRKKATGDSACQPPGVCAQHPGARGHRWWVGLPDICPVSQFPVSLLPYPPFRWRVDDKFWRSEDNVRGEVEYILLDGLTAVLQAIKTMDCSILGHQLSPGSIRALDRHMKLCKLGSFRLQDALDLQVEATRSKEAEQKLDQLRKRASRRLVHIRALQRQRKFSTRAA